MIPMPAIQEWQKSHPWKRAEQVEQDLLLEAVLHRSANARLVALGKTCPTHRRAPFA